MIYVDSSVALAYLLAEPRTPSPHFWDLALASSRLLEYEVWNRIHTRQIAESRGSETGVLLSGIQMVELSEPILARALEPWPTRIRTLDALHLATVDHLRRQGESVELASYDNRLIAAARALGIAILEL